MFFRTACIPAFLVCLFTAAQGQDLAIPPVAYPVLARTAVYAESFVPPGWRIEHRADGDLDGDGRKDIALILRQISGKNILANKGLGPKRFDTNPRILAVALAGKGAYRLIVQDNRFIPRRTNPILEDVLADAEKPAIDKGFLRIEMRIFASAGSWTAGGRAFHFIYRNGKLLLARFDSDSIHRASGNTTDRHFDFQAGTRTETRGNIAHDRTSRHATRIAKRKLLAIGEIGDGLMFDPDATRH